MAHITFDLATHADEAALRRILRASPMPGSISVTFEREPDYFRASTIEGTFHQTIVARDSATGEIIGMGTRSVRPEATSCIQMSPPCWKTMRPSPIDGQRTS